MTRLHPLAWSALRWLIGLALAVALTYSVGTLAAHVLPAWLGHGLGGGVGCTACGLFWYFVPDRY